MLRFSLLAWSIKWKSASIVEDESAPKSILEPFVLLDVVERSEIQRFAASATIPSSALLEKLKSDEHIASLEKRKLWPEKNMMESSTAISNLFLTRCPHATPI